MKQWKYVAILGCSTLIVACGKPSEMSDEDYKKYKDFAAPKILYSCTEQGVPRSGYAKCNPNGDINKLADCMDAASKNVEKVTVVNYTAGLGGGVTYNEIMNQAKNSCRGDFKILDSKT